MGNHAIVAGVGMVKFTKPGESLPYNEMGREATLSALADAGVAYDQVQEAYVGYVYGDTCCGQRALYGVGMTGIPITNVTNACSTGSNALYLARRAIETGAADCVLALGFEQMQRGALPTNWQDRVGVFEHFDNLTTELVGDIALPFALRYFGGAGKEHMDRYGTPLETFAAVRAKASRHAVKNPLAVFRREVTTEDVMNDQVLWPGVMTRLMVCPPTCGAAAALLVSEAFAKKHGINADVRILAQSMTTDSACAFEDKSMIELVGSTMARNAANAVYQAAGIGPDDIDVCELHDCFAHNEVVSYEALGLCPIGGSAKFVADGDNTYGGKVVTNPSGGLLSKGHPLGATGLAQCFELTRQIRGTAGATQVEGARLALQHNLGLGGAVVVTLYGHA